MAGCPEDTCIKSGPHGWHSDGTRVWPDEEHQAKVKEQFSRPKGRKTTKAKVDKFLNGDTSDEWVAASLDTVVEWLRGRREPFTTAEDVWPLLDAPQDMRIMRRVVTALLRDRAIEEVGAIRLRGTYETRDGQTFSENKLVPKYASRIWNGA